MSDLTSADYIAALTAAREATPTPEQTRHHVEAYIDGDRIASRLICEDETTCNQTHPEFRKYGCAVRDWYENTGEELLDFPQDVHGPGPVPGPVIGRIEVRCDWRGHGEDAELHLVPPPTVTEINYRNQVAAREVAAKYGQATIPAIKDLRRRTHLNLREAKHALDTALATPKETRP